MIRLIPTGKIYKNDKGELCLTTQYDVSDENKEGKHEIIASNISFANPGEYTALLNRNIIKS